MLTNVLILFPLLFAMLVRVVPNKIVWSVSLGASLFQVFITSLLVYNFVDSADHPSLTSKFLWIESIGAYWNVALDGMSLIMVGLVTLLLPLVLVVRKNAISETHNLHSLIWWMTGAMYGVFVAEDGLLFYTFWEFSLIPIYFICLKWGDADRVKVTLKFFLYTLAGSLTMLASLIYVYLNGSSDWSIDALYQAGAGLNPIEQQWVFIGFFLAFAIKIPIVPFHGWQPDTYQSAPLQGTLLLSTLMGKMGLWGLIKWLIPMTPLAFQTFQNGIIILCVISVLYASIVALQQNEIKRLIAWASMAHVSLMAASIFVWQKEGLEGSLLQMFNHGVITLALFYCASIITNKSGLSKISELGGLRNNMPSFSGFFLWILMASIALPFTSGFPGEFSMLYALYQYQPVLAALAGLGTILGAVYMLRAYHQMMHGDSKFTFHDIHQNNKALLAVGSGLILLFGIFPNLLGILSDETIVQYLSQLSSNQ